MHEQAANEASGQDTEHDTEHVTDQDTPQDTDQGTDQDAEHVTEHVERLITVLTGEMNRPQLQAALRLSNRPHFLMTYLRPALDAGLIEMTLPDKPTSRNQRYRRTAAGEALARRITKKNPTA